MKVFRTFLILLLLGVLAVSQTFDLGKSIYYSDEGAINIAADAGLAVRSNEKPYVMFVLYLISDPDVTANLHREDVSLFYEGREYSMPAFKEFRKEYNGDRKDISMYLRLGREPLIMSQMKNYRFNWDYDFFPARNEKLRLTDEGYISSSIGFITRAYFKNPGFEKGDTAVIRVRDKNDPRIWGSVAVEF